ncbi:TIGR00153 family protein [Psychromonas sp. CD1]|uniref:TIGR00153 family protein n=1 Tax=Psychromonas sp. CD1 TaxID=1979839 RepID=UPI000B9A1A41|nr:TIGR00153 family protein [Psychromonas sp. CD1]
MPVNSIFGVFAKSPIKPIQMHVDKVAACSALLIPFLQASIKADWIEAEKIRKQISTLEKEADELKKELRMTLPKGIFMPISRIDLIELVNRQDRIANTVKDIAGRMYGRELQIPNELLPTFIPFVQRCIDSVNQAKKAVNELDELLETGFRGREVTFVTKMITELSSIEDDTDSLQIQQRRLLFSIEKQHDPIDIIFLYQILEWIGQLADHAELIGTQLELILVRS